MSAESEKYRLASLRQDHKVLSATLGASGVRRIIANLIDIIFTLLIAFLLRDLSVNPWLATLYFLIRDLPPIGRSIEKVLTGIAIYSVDSLSPAAPKQLLIRGATNSFIVLPLGLLLMT